MEPLARRRIRNRILAVMAHIPRYTIQGQARLAKDAGVAPSTISRFVRGKSNPSFAVVMAVTSALESHLGRKVAPRELVSLNGTFLTPSVCELCGCSGGCLPPQIYDNEDTIMPEYRNLKPGKWQMVCDREHGCRIEQTMEDEQ